MSQDWLVHRDGKKLNGLCTPGFFDQILYLYIHVGWVFIEVKILPSNHVKNTKLEDEGSHRF